MPHSGDWPVDSVCDGVWVQCCQHVHHGLKYVSFGSQNNKKNKDMHVMIKQLIQSGRLKTQGGGVVLDQGWLSNQDYGGLEPKVAMGLASLFDRRRCVQAAIPTQCSAHVMQPVILCRRAGVGCPTALVQKG